MLPLGPVALLTGGVLYLTIKRSGTNSDSSIKLLERKQEISKRLGRPTIFTNPYEDYLIGDAINPDCIEVVLESIGGLENIKDQLDKLVVQSLNPGHIDFMFESIEDFENIKHKRKRPPIFTNPYEDYLINNAINPNRIEVVLESIGGLVNIKDQLDKLVVQSLNPGHIDFVFESIEDFENIKHKPKSYLTPREKLDGPLKGVLLYGPPGTGKTMLAKAIAKESGAVIINVKASNLMSRVLGDSEKLVAALFTLSRKLQPAIMFIDEFDDFLGKRKSSDNQVIINMKDQFMRMWRDFTTGQNARVMILAITNRPLVQLDGLILQSFNCYEIKMPDCEERASIFKVTMKGERVDENIDYDYLAGLCEGSTGSDLVDLCNKAAYFSVTEPFDAEKNGNPNQARRPLAQADLEKAFWEYKKTTTAAQEYSRRVYRN